MELYLGKAKVCKPKTINRYSKFIPFFYYIRLHKVSIKKMKIIVAQYAPGHFKEE